MEKKVKIKKIFIVIIILLLFFLAVVMLFFKYRKIYHQEKGLGGNDVMIFQDVDNSSDKSSISEKKVEDEKFERFKGIVLKINEKEITIGSKEGKQEIFKIDPKATNVYFFNKEINKKSNLSGLKVGQSVEVSYYKESRQITAIIIEK